MVLAALLALSVLAQNVGDPTGGKVLVFQQDFSKLRTISPKAWKFDDGPSYNNEAEKYTSASGGNAYIKGGVLVIEARKNKGVITSARLQSVDAWQYPYVEVLAKTPKGRGTWPAIWMLGDGVRRNGANHLDWPRCGEIDIMENVGYEPAKYHFSLHSLKAAFDQDNNPTLTKDFDPDAFHRFGMLCTPDEIVFYVDGAKVFTVTRQQKDPEIWPYDAQFFLILNLAIGGDWGGAHGIDDAIFPSRFYIASVKVYQ